ncbi:MAG: DUF3054 domain-containing protein [Actinomycetota bacterium]
MSGSTAPTADGSPARPATRAEQRPSGTALVAADLVALLAFVGVGLRSHHIGPVAEVAARNLLPLAVMWAVVALAVGTYRRRDLASLLITWVSAVPVALLVRTWWVGSPQGGRILVFVAVGLTSTLLLLLIGRAVVAVLSRTRPVWNGSSRLPDGQ